QSKNLILTSVIFVTGLSGLKINFLGVSLSGMVLASVVAVVLSLLFYVFDRMGIMND
ncbi:MAG: uracil permease, partial [Finegoldia magna]|nr:uracil permease [Finegoldia magna]